MVYDAAQTIAVTRADAVVLGLGMATLTAVNGAVPFGVGSIKGVIVAGITVDAGTVNSPALMTIGAQRVDGAPACTACSDPADPTTLSDVFFRIGRPHVGKARIALVVNSDNVILDDIWSWRADHGVDGSVGWNINTPIPGWPSTATTLPPPGFSSSTTGSTTSSGTARTARRSCSRTNCPTTRPIRLPGNKVACWAGRRRRWRRPCGPMSCGAVAVCAYTNVNPWLHATRAFEVPVTRGVAFHHLLTVQLLAGLIDHVINEGLPA